MNKFIKYLAPAATLLLSWGLQSCVNDLHVEPIDPSQKTNIEAYQLFNKCYSAFGTSGNNGGDDNVDIDGHRWWYVKPVPPDVEQQRADHR